MMWNGLPAIRKEIAECMINDFGLNQKETAKKMGITPAAICQYVSNKRGRENITDEYILKEIKKAAQNIIENGNDYFIQETCRICRIMRSMNLFSFNVHEGEF
jgi:predicted transcriptional regulator